MAQMTVRRETSRPIQAAYMETRKFSGKVATAKNESKYSSTGRARSLPPPIVAEIAQDFDKQADDAEGESDPGERFVAVAVDHELIGAIGLPEWEAAVPIGGEFDAMVEIETKGEQQNDRAAGDGKLSPAFELIAQRDVGDGGDGPEAADGVREPRYDQH